MAAPQEVLNDLIEQHRERSKPSDDVQADLEHQWRLRNGDYDTNSVAGKAQQAWGAAEMVGKFVTGFVAAGVSAAPSALLSLGEPSNPAWLAERDRLGIPRGPGDTDSFAEEFGLMTDFYTYQPRSAKGKRYNQAVEDVYNKYMVEKLHGYLMEQVSKEKLTPEEAVAIRIAAEAALLATPIKGGQLLGRAAFRAGRVARGRVKPSGDTVNIYDNVDIRSLPAVERYQRYNQEAPLKMLPPPEGALETAVSRAVKSDIPAKEVAKTIENAKTEVVAAEAIEKFVAEDNISQEQIGVRLQSQEARDSLQWLGNELSVGGNIGLVPRITSADHPYSLGRLESTPRDEFNQPVADLIRTPSTNPEWFKQMNQHQETKMGVKKVWQTVDKAIAGKRLGARERRVVDLMLDTVEAMGEEYFAKILSPGRFPSRQSGAVNPDVIAEAVARALRPGIVTAKSMADIAHAVARQVAFKQVTDIRKINSPTAKMLADRIMPLEKSKIPLAGGFHELVSMKEGEYKTRLDSILAPLRRHTINKNVSSSLRIIGLPKRINDALIHAMETGEVPVELAPAARALRAIMDELYEYQIEAGADLGYLPNHFPHLYAVNKIRNAEVGRKKGGKFVRWLVEDLGFSLEAAGKTKRTIIHEEGFLEFVEDSGGRLQKGQDYAGWARAHRVGGGPTIPRHTKSRKIQTTVKDAKGWLVNDLEAILNSYITRAVNHAEYTRIAGRGERKLNQMVRQIIEEQQISAESGGEVIINSPHQTAQEIYDMFDAMQHRFHQIELPAWRSGQRALAGYQVLHKLALVTMAQIPETFVPIAKYRLATTAKALVGTPLEGMPIPLKSLAFALGDAAQNLFSSASLLFTGKRVISNTEVRKHLQRLGISEVSALSSSANRFVGPTGVITHRFIRGVGMEVYTDFQRTFSYDVIQSLVRQNARYLSKNTEGKKARQFARELTELGIPPEMAVEWYKDGMPKYHPIEDRFDIMQVRGVNTTTIKPTPANSPRLYNNPKFQLLVLFTRFFTAFGNTVIPAIARQIGGKDVTNVRRMGALSGVAAMIASAYYMTLVREDITGYSYRDRDDPLRIIDATDRAGLFGMATRLYPLFSAYKYNMGSKYVANVVGGPVAGDVAKLIDAAKGTRKQRARWMANQTPLFTVTPESEQIMYEFYLEFLNAIED